MLNKETYKQKQITYVNGDISFEEFFLWLAEELRIGVSLFPAKLQKTLAKSKPRSVYMTELSTLPLADWEVNHAIIAQRASSFGISWSLSFTVCVLKVVAVKHADSIGKEDEKV